MSRWNQVRVLSLLRSFAGSLPLPTAYAVGCILSPLRGWSGQARRRRGSVSLLAATILLGTLPASATDVAILRNGFSIRHERREVVGGVTRLYLSSTDKTGYVDVPTSDIDHLETEPASPQAATQLPDVVSLASVRYHLDPDLVNSVIRAESGFNAKAVSPKGAQGLMQLMPATATSLGVSNAFDPSANVEGATRYLRELLVKYNFDLIKALAAYNAGSGRVEQYHGVPPFNETQAYVAKIVREFNRKKLAERKANPTLSQRTRKNGVPTNNSPTLSQSARKDGAPDSSSLRSSE
jgi:Transglycosylase SLT domain